MKGMIIGGALALLTAVAGCGTPPKPSLWVRTDGQSARVHPELRTQLEVDQIACNGEMQKAALSGVTIASGGIAGAIAQGQRNAAAMDVAKGCMAEKGYVLVPEDEAAAKSAEFAAANAKLKRPPAKVKKAAR